MSSRKHSICILSRLSLDISVVKNCETNAAIEEAFSSLVEGFPEEDIDQEVIKRARMISAELNVLFSASSTIGYDIPLCPGSNFTTTNAPKYSRILMSIELAPSQTLDGVLF